MWGQGEAVRGLEDRAHTQWEDSNPVRPLSQEEAQSLKGGEEQEDRCTPRQLHPKKTTAPQEDSSTPGRQLYPKKTSVPQDSCTFLKSQNCKTVILPNWVTG